VQTRGTPILAAAAVLRTLVPGTSPLVSTHELLENSPMSQQALISGRMLTGTYCSFK
jgi:hypothetical protein